MNIKGNTRYVCLALIVFLVIYLFLAARPIGPDISFEPVWTRDITGPLASSTDAAAYSARGVEAFELADRFGYFTADGTLLSSTKADGMISASRNGWAVYPRNARNTVIHFPDGRPRMTVPGSGFVHLDGNRTYLFLPGGNGVSQFSGQGTLVWTREHTAPITAFGSSEGGTVIGYADGMIACLAPDGTERFAFYPGGSDYQAIFGAALSADGSLVACVSGSNRQRFLLISVAGHKVINHVYLEGNLTRQAYVAFEKNGTYAFFESAKGLGIVNCEKFSVHTVPINGELVATGSAPGEALFTVLSRNGTSWTLSGIERPDHLVARAVFEAHHAFLIQDGDAMYLGADDRISRINIRGIQ